MNRKRNHLHKLIALVGFAYIWGCEAPGLLESTFSKPVQQVDLDRVAQMPNAPEPYQSEDWYQKARDLDAYLYDTTTSGPYQPFIWTDHAERNFPEVAYGLYTAVGDVRQGPDKNNGEAHEAICMLGSINGSTLVGIDNAPAMLTKAAEKLAHLQDRHQIELRCENAGDGSFTGSSVVVMNYTLQFLPLAERRPLLQAIYDGLAPGGLLFLSEKVKSGSPRSQETITHHYEAFKARNGYAQTEIERKKEALENVLVPLTYEQQIQMLRDTGFSHVDSLIRLHNFVSFVALK